MFRWENTGTFLGTEYFSLECGSFNKSCTSHTEKPSWLFRTFWFFVHDDELWQNSSISNTDYSKGFWAQLYIQQHPGPAALPTLDSRAPASIIRRRYLISQFTEYPSRLAYTDICASSFDFAYYCPFLWINSLYNLAFPNTTRLV